MRSNEERVAAVKWRVTQVERKKRQRRNRVVALVSVAACLAVIVGISFAMLGVSEKLTAGDYAGYEAAASIFSDSTVAGYLIVGLLAFVLGVCVTVLCIKLKAFQKTDTETEDSDNRAS